MERREKGNNSILDRQTFDLVLKRSPKSERRFSYPIRFYLLSLETGFGNGESGKIKIIRWNQIV